MTTEGKKHQKHAKLNRVNFGKFARHEVAILGSPCDDIRDLAQTILTAHGAHFQMGYLDADHQSFKEDVTPIIISKGATKSILFKQTVEDITLKYSDNPFTHHLSNNDLDILLVNGNHFEASTQIVIADERKRDSLERHAHRLSNVHAVYLPENVQEVPHWLNDLIPPERKYSILSSEEELVNWFGSFLRTIQPPLKGLVLTGGKSTRMGEDKSAIAYYGKPQYEHLASLIAPFCDDVYISVRPGQQLDSEYSLISDRFMDLGPYSGILSAFMTDPESAWLVVAVDLPLLQTDEIDHLVHHRNSGKLATALFNEVTNFPDPLCTIWEPRAYKKMLEFLSIGYSCPRKVLINSDIEMIEPLHSESLKNINTPEEKTEVMEQLRSK